MGRLIPHSGDTHVTLPICLFPAPPQRRFFCLQAGAKKPAEAGNDRKVLTSRVYQRARNKPAREALIRFANTPARMARMP